MTKWMSWVMALVMAGTFLSSCKDSNPGYVKEEKQNLVERQKALKEVTDFVDKANKKAERR